MAPKLLYLSLCIFLFSLVILLLSLVLLPLLSSDKPSAFEFIKHLQGCHKGEQVKDLHKLKKYLENFGYLAYPHSENGNHANDDDFDDLLESAVKTYQRYYHLEPTGTLDTPTVAKMLMPRCGMPDIINSPLHTVSHYTVSHYSFFNGKPKWPDTKTHFTFGFLPDGNTKAISAIARAFDRWGSATHFTFSRVQDYSNADLKVSFHSGDHGDGFPFDGPGGVLAHSFGPPGGKLHYDIDDSWAVGPTPGTSDVETVALHEIGHLLGLGHSSVEDAIMFASIPSGVTKGLHGDDIAGIKALYNKSESPNVIFPNTRTRMFLQCF